MFTFAVRDIRSAEPAERNVRFITAATGDAWATDRLTVRAFVKRAATGNGRTYATRPPVYSSVFSGRACSSRPINVQTVFNYSAEIVYEIRACTAVYKGRDFGNVTDATRRISRTTSTGAFGTPLVSEPGRVSRRRQYLRFFSVYRRFYVRFAVSTRAHFVFGLSRNVTVIGRRTSRLRRDNYIIPRFSRPFHKRTFDTNGPRGNRTTFRRTRPERKRVGDSVRNTKQRPSRYSHGRRTDARASDL